MVHRWIFVSNLPSTCFQLVHAAVVSSSHCYSCPCFFRHYSYLLLDEFLSFLTLNVAFEVGMCSQNCSSADRHSIWESMASFRLCLLHHTLYPSLHSANQKQVSLQKSLYHVIIYNLPWQLLRIKMSQKESINQICLHYVGKTKKEMIQGSVYEVLKTSLNPQRHSNTFVAVPKWCFPPYLTFLYLPAFIILSSVCCVSPWKLIFPKIKFVDHVDVHKKTQWRVTVNGEKWGNSDFCQQNISLTDH